MPDQPQYPHAVIIPGGGLTDRGALPPWVKARLEAALKAAGDSSLFILLSGATVHKPPPLDDHGYPLFESRVGGRWLASRGVEKERIFTEISSYDTIGNAYFSRVIHIQPAGLKNLLIVTSSFHMARTRAAFEWVYGLRPGSRAFQLSFQASPDAGLSRDALLARRKREAKSLSKLQETRKPLTNLEDFHRWLFTEHRAYTLTPDRGSLSQAEMLSY